MHGNPHPAVQERGGRHAPAMSSRTRSQVSHAPRPITANPSNPRSDSPLTPPWSSFSSSSGRHMCLTCSGPAWGHVLTQACITWAVSGFFTYTMSGPCVTETADRHRLLMLTTTCRSSTHQPALGLGLGLGHAAAAGCTQACGTGGLPDPHAIYLEAVEVEERLARLCVGLQLHTQAEGGYRGAHHVSVETSRRSRRPASRLVAGCRVLEGVVGGAGEQEAGPGAECNLKL